MIAALRTAALELSRRFHEEPVIRQQLAEEKAAQATAHGEMLAAREERDTVRRALAERTEERDEMEARRERAVQAQQIIGRERDGLEARVRRLTIERDDAMNERNAIDLCAGKVAAERDQALKDAADLRTMWQQAEADAESLQRVDEELRARHVEVLRLREEELAGALELPALRSWPDLLDAVRRVVARPTGGDAVLVAQLNAAQARAAALAEQVRKLQAELAEQMLVTAGVSK